MKKLTIILVVILLSACKNETKQQDYKESNLNVTTSIYPDDITKIFEAHGGIDSWNEFSSLKFDIPREGFNEEHILNLKNRKSLIKYDHHWLGFDGEKVWLKNLDSTTYKSDPKFYYNLMSYFYAMPFILGDPGIKYEEGPELEVGEEIYPGILIGYEDGVGTSPEDEYIIYYDPETYQMTYLAYTVTYFTKEKADKFSLIKYAEWEDVNGLILPSTLQWYKFEDGEVGEMRNELKFTNAELSKDPPSDEIFMPDEGAEIFE